MGREAVLAVIPARGGSKGLSRKNLRPLGGLPLICHSIRVALRCASIKKTVVSSEDDEILKVASQEGAEIIERPGELAGDDVPTHSVVRHVIDTLANRGEWWPYILLLQPTSPLRTGRMLDGFLDHFFSSNARSGISVMEREHTPYKDFVVTDEFLQPLFERRFLEMRRQSLPAVYRQTGSVYMVETKAFLEESSFFLEPCVAFVPDPILGVDIDTADDLAEAERRLALLG